MLTTIKLLLGISDTSKDTLLNALIDRCIDELKTFTNRSSVSDYSSLIVSMVLYNYNLLGTEGVNSENYSGVSFSYAADYPDNIVRQMKSLRKLQVI